MDINDNKPTNMPRTPQLGDTRTFHGGAPLPESDATLHPESSSKGLPASETVFQGEGLLAISGGSPTATSESQKNFATDPNLPVSETDVGTTPTLPPVDDSLLARVEAVAREEIARLEAVIGKGEAGEAAPEPVVDATQPGAPEADVAKDVETGE